MREMESNDEVWADWLAQDNEYAVGDRKSMEAGGGKYLNFIAIVLRREISKKKHLPGASFCFQAVEKSLSLRASPQTGVAIRSQTHDFCALA